MTDQELVRELRKHLGARLVAYIAGATSTATVAAWADGSQELADDRRERLRIALAAAELLAVHDDATTIQSWFQGVNELLGDRAPAAVLREDATRIASRVMAAANDFAGGR